MVHKMLVLGVSYKKDVDDLRESPALTIIELLKRQGADVSYHDPYFPVLLKGRHYDLQMQRASLENLNEYDCVAIITDHSDYDYPESCARLNWWRTLGTRRRGIASPKIVRC